MAFFKQTLHQELGVGDRIITYNDQKGIVIGMDQDYEDNTPFVLVKLDGMDGEYAYEFSELTRTQVAQQNLA